ncbi:MAG: histidine kinase N-terminal 7TM domain-containing protein [Syntrophomonas sp.]|nr:histidine kinase N-terminal 7TM domain-containing protein [Syntrophomonas sp.]
MQIEAWTITLLLSGIVYFFIACFVFWHFRSNAGAKSFIALMVVGCIYSVGYYFEIHSSTIPAMFFWLKIEYIGIAPLPALWILFVVRYTKKEHFFDKTTAAALFIIPIITYIMVYTNNHHHLFYRSMDIVVQNGLNLLNMSRGPWYWINICYLNLLILMGNIILLRSWRQTQAPLNQQYAAMFFGSLVPWGGLLVYLSGNSPLNLDLSPFGMIFTGLVYMFSLIHFRFFDIIPVASTVVLEKMRDGVLVVDTRERIVDMNTAAVNYFGRKSDIIGCKLETLFQPNSGIAVNIMNAAAEQWEFQENTPQGSKWLDMMFSPLTNRQGETRGHAIIVRDITKRKMAQAQLEMANTELSRRNRELDYHNSEMKHLNEMSALLHTCTLLEEAYPIIEKYMQIQLPELGGGLYVFSPEHNAMELAASWGDAFSIRKAFNNDECWGLCKGEIYRHSGDDLEATCAHIEKEKGGNYVCHPLIIEGIPFGLLHYHYLSNDVNDNHIQLTRIVVDAIKLALSNLKMKENLRQESIRDHLTGLYNRRYMAETMKLEMFKAQRTGDPLSIIMVDVDNYKGINDLYGHTRGDQVLFQVSQLFQENIRNGDIACRYGGDEFILVLPGAPLEIAFARAELIRQAAKNMVVKLDESGEQLMTLSMGVATYPDHASTVESLVQAADSALYAAKQAGRDQTKTAS